MDTDMDLAIYLSVDTDMDRAIEKKTERLSSNRQQDNENTKLNGH